MAEPDFRIVYLLRLWLTDEEGRPAWRASLESVHNGERRSFPGLEELFEFLRQAARARTLRPPGPGKPQKS